LNVFTENKAWAALHL